MAAQNATYVTVADSQAIRSSCMIDLDQEFPYVTDVEKIDIEIDNVEEEYVDVNGDKILTFHTEEGYIVEDGTGFSITELDSDSKLYLFLTDKED